MRAKIHIYRPLHERVFAGIKAENDSAFGDVPFYGLPSIDLRGVSATRYQNEHAGAIEAQLRVKVWKRFSLVGFGGFGWSVGKFSGPNERSVVPAGGGGARFLLSKKQGLHVGFDVARSPGQTAFYMQIGNAW